MTKHQVTWLRTRPDLTIRFLRGTSRNCYHQSWFEVISARVLNTDDIARLDACGLLGMGQGYDLESTETIIDTVQPVTLDMRTGQPAKDDAGQDVPPRGYDDQPFTRTTDYTYQRYVVRRICDSGD